MSKNKLRRVLKFSFWQDNIHHIHASLTNKVNELFPNISIPFHNNLQTSKKTLKDD
jgi:hypothetical protein